MSDRGLPNSEHKMLGLVNKGTALVRSRPVIVVFNRSMDRIAIKTVLDHASVAGIIAADEVNAKQFNDHVRIGYRINGPATRWSFPQARGRAAVVLGGSDSVGLWIAWEAFRRGVTDFVFVEPDKETVTRYSLASLVARLVARLVAHRVSDSNNAFLHWIRQFPDWIKQFSGLIRQPFDLVKSFTYSKKQMFLEKQIFAFRLRRMFRVARRKPRETSSVTETALLIIGSLGAGGSERQAVNTALTLLHTGGPRPVLACSRLSLAGSGFYRKFIENAGIEIVDVSKIDATAALQFQKDRPFDLCISDDELFREDVLRYLVLFSQLRPRVIHSFLDENNVKAGTAAVLARVPRIVLSARSVAPDHFKWLVKDYMRPGYKVLLRQTGVVLCCNSRAGARDYKRWLGRPFLPIPVISNGVNFHDFAVRSEVDRDGRARWQIPSEALVVTSIMRYSEEKQPALWAAVAIEISRRQANVYFIVVGDGPLRSDVEGMLQEASIAGRVRVIPQTLDVPALLRTSDLFLLTSRTEGLPNVLIEAQAIGVPVVTTPAGGAAETLNPGITGLVAPDHSVSGVANACLTLLADDELRARMSKAAPEFVRRKFSLERMLADTVRLYQV